MDFIINIVLGIIASIFIAGAGYFKAQAYEEFDLGKFSKTLILGAFVGLVVGFTGFAPDVITAMPIYAGFTAFLDSFFKGTATALKQ